MNIIQRLIKVKIHTQDAQTFIGSNIILMGWVHRFRQQGKQIGFIDLRDGSGVIQCIVNSDTDMNVASI